MHQPVLVFDRERPNAVVDYSVKPKDENDSGLIRRVTTQDEQGDHDLIRRVAMRDEQAFEVLYRRFAPRLGSYLWKLLRKRELVEEALNDTMLTVWQNAVSYDFRGRLSTWLFGITHNKGLKVCTKSRRHAAHQSLETIPTGSPDALVELTDDDHPERHLIRRESIEALANGLKALSPDHRAVIELTFIEGFSYSEISTIVECPVNTVKTRVFHARKHLSAYLRAIG